MDKRLSEAEKLLNKVELRKVNTYTLEENMIEMRKKIDRLNDRLDENKSKSLTIERFVEKFIPIQIQSQLSETLRAVLNRKFLDKLDGFEHFKYLDLNENLLTLNLTDMTSEMKKLYDYILEENKKIRAKKPI